MSLQQNQYATKVFGNRQKSLAWDENGLRKEENDDDKDKMLTEKMLITTKKDYYIDEPLLQDIQRIHLKQEIQDASS